MKRTIPIIAFILIAVWGVMALSQQPAPFKLKPEASKKFIEIGQAHGRVLKECNTALVAHAEAQQALLIGAEVPVEMRGNCQADETGIVMCSKPAAK